MPLSTPSTIASVTQENSQYFMDTFAAADARTGWRQVVVELPSGNKSGSRSTWYGSPPKMRDVTDGPLNVEDAYLNTYSFDFKTFKAALRMKRTWIEDDDLGLIPPLVAGLAQEAARFPGEHALEALSVNPLAFDGTALIADSRSIGKSGTIDNNIGASASDVADPTVAEVRTALNDVRAAMTSFKDDQGRVMGLAPNMHIIPQTYSDAFFAALSGNQTSGIGDQVLPQSDNNLYTVNGHTFFVNHLTTDTDAFYSLRIDGTQGPLGWSTRVPASLEEIGDSSDSYVIDDEIVQAVRMRGERAVGDPRRIIKTTFT